MRELVRAAGWSFSLAVLAFSCFQTEAKGAEPVVGAESKWLEWQKWDEGMAEVCLYTARFEKYGATREAKVEIVTVREHFDPVKLVKTLPEQEKTVLPILKMNLTRIIPTGVYEYRQMTSAFVHRLTGELMKLSCVSAEWCGNSFALFERKTPAGKLIISNYFDDQGTLTKEAPAPKGVLFQDAIILYFRQHLNHLKAGDSLNLIAPLMRNKPVYRLSKAKIDWVRDAPMDVLEEEVRVRRIRVAFDGGEAPTEIYSFKLGPARELVHWEDNRGQFFSLRKRMWLDYWNRNRPGDEKLLD